MVDRAFDAAAHSRTRNQALKEAAAIARKPISETCCNRPIINRRGDQECCGSPVYRWGDPGEIAAAIEALIDE